MDDDRIMELFGQVPYFADQTIEAFDTESYRAKIHFMTSAYWCSEASINLGNVCGTMHPDYGGMTWREFLANGKRMDGNISAYQKNPGYYTKHVERLPGMYYKKFGPKTYVSGHGDHRTCIGKFYLYTQDNPYIHNVSLEEEEFDEVLFALHGHVLANPDVFPGMRSTSVVRTDARREDGPGWHREFYSLAVRVETDRGSLLMDRDELWKRLHSVEQERPAGFLSRLFGNGRK